MLLDKWPARHDLSCWQSRKTSTQTDNTNKNWLIEQLLEPHYLYWRRGYPSVNCSVNGRATPFMSPDNEGQSAAGRSMIGRRSYEVDRLSVDCRPMIGRQSPLCTDHQIPKNRRKREKNYNLATSAKKDRPTTKTAKFWHNVGRLSLESSYFGLTGIGHSSVWEMWLGFCEGTLFYQLYWRGQHWVFIVLKMQNESTWVYIRGYFIYAWLHCMNPVSPVLCNVWHFYRRIHWLFLVPSRFFSLFFENFSRLFEKYSRSFEKKSFSFFLSFLSESLNLRGGHQTGFGIRAQRGEWGVSWIKEANS